MDEVRTPGADDAKVTKLADGHYKVVVDRTSGRASSHDFVFYYRLAENLPGRVELMTYKPKANSRGRS